MVAAKISESDREQIEKLRELVRDELTPYYDTDFNLLRWLQGHNYKIDEILPKLKNHLTFRRSRWDLDHVADKPRDHPIHAHWKAGLSGLSGKIPNSFINVEQTGANDYWGLLQTYPLNEIMRARIHDLEYMLRKVMEEEERTGEQCHVIYIMDLTGLQFDRRLMGLLTGALSSISAFMAEHYVEMIHKFILVNVPSFISTIWSIVKPLLPERTKNKVKIFGSNWKSEILEYANPEVLPVFWNEGNEETFKAPLERAVPFPESGYYNQGAITDARQLDVPAGKTGCVTVEAAKGQKFSWTFQTDGHFAYACFLAPADDPQTEDPARMTAVYPRFNKVPGPTHVPLHDHIECSEAGVYKLWFSNEHAWLHTLRVHYRIKLE
ncbi:CRAL-TRIO domain-containing protein [Aphelenchoides fujianensis]|nr:CRAL-TRIO domain-containing protein [Aphelenchoides fujianensis]